MREELVSEKGYMNVEDVCSSDLTVRRMRSGQLPELCLYFHTPRRIELQMSPSVALVEQHHISWVHSKPPGLGCGRSVRAERQYQKCLLQSSKPKVTTVFFQWWHLYPSTAGKACWVLSKDLSESTLANASRHPGIGIRSRNRPLWVLRWGPAACGIGRQQHC